MVFLFPTDESQLGESQDQWQGLPLMSWPTHGRDSHHETRVMRDDVMSYGDGDAVSAITLASFEDMGHYLARYGALDATVWQLGRVAMVKNELK